MDRIEINGAVTRYEPQTCTVCNGQKGTTVTEIDGTVIRQSWRPCTACGGRGVR